MSKRPELTAAERALPYAKFYDLPITPIPEEKLAVLAAGPIDPSLALKIEDRNDLFKPGYLPCEIGYCVMPNGTGFLANRTEMPGVTPEMFEWWFAWHSLEDLRYRIWDPEDHYYARPADAGEDPGPEPAHAGAHLGHRPPCAGGYRPRPRRAGFGVPLSPRAGL